MEHTKALAEVLLLEALERAFYPWGLCTRGLSTHASERLRAGQREGMTDREVRQFLFDTIPSGQRELPSGTMVFAGRSSAGDAMGRRTCEPALWTEAYPYGEHPEPHLMGGSLIHLFRETLGVPERAEQREEDAVATDPIQPDQMALF